MVNTIVKQALSTVDKPSILEPPGLCRTDGKRPDGMTLLPWQRGMALIWDATIVDALAPSRIAAHSNTTAAEDAETKKCRKYEEISSRGYIFQPIAFETQGNCGPSTASFLHSLSLLLVNETKEKRAGAFLLQRLSIAIQAGNAASVLGTLQEGEKLDDIFNL